MSKDEYFGVKCPKCGWVGSSEESAGGEPIADSGDYSDLVCPKCPRWPGVVLEDASEAELCDEIKRIRSAPPVEAVSPSPSQALEAPASEALLGRISIMLVELVRSYTALVGYSDLSETTRRRFDKVSADIVALVNLHARASLSGPAWAGAPEQP